MTDISVVMGCYNSASLLPDTLDSILMQEDVNLECIIINDGSDDSSLKILQQYAEKDQRLKVEHKSHQGLTHALISGCNAARGKYIARIDAGDVMLPGRLRQQMEILTSWPDCVFLSCYTEFCGPDWEYMWLASGAPDDPQPVSILPRSPENGLDGDISHHGSVMFRKKSYHAVGGYRDAFFYGQDWDLWYRLAELGSFFVVPERLYRARVFPYGISMASKTLQDGCASCSLGAFIARQKGKNEKQWIEKAKTYRPPTTGKDTANRQRKKNMEPGLYFIGEALRRNNNAKCRSYFIQAVRQAPLRKRAYFRYIQSFL